MSSSRRLGLNQGSYGGERINIDEVMAEIADVAAMHGWTSPALLPGTTTPLHALRRTSADPRRRVYVSAGIHGDEPAGPLAARALLAANAWPADAELWLCPCLNPTGFRCGTRENDAGIDLNRDYRHLYSREVRAHVAWLQTQGRFDLTLCLHEDWESHGFYLYELNSSQHAMLAPRVLAAAGSRCPIESSPEIDNWPAQGGVITSVADPFSRSDWAEAIYLLAHHTSHACTFEAPSDFPLSVRVAALVAAVNAALEPW
jgi:protein MpaA